MENRVEIPSLPIILYKLCAPIHAANIGVHTVCCQQRSSLSLALALQVKDMGG